MGEWYFWRDALVIGAVGRGGKKAGEEEEETGGGKEEQLGGGGAGKGVRGCTTPGSSC